MSNTTPEDLEQLQEMAREMQRLGDLLKAPQSLSEAAEIRKAMRILAEGIEELATK